jgi:leucyl aminopeptidase (aminopeptidase T)
MEVYAMERMTWVKGARVLIDDSLRLRARENVLVVGDTTTVRIVEMLAYLCAERGAQVTVCLMEPTGVHSGEPPAPVAAAMKAADVIITPTAYSMSHTNARIEANAAGARIALIPGANEALFSGGGLEVNIRDLAKTAVQVGTLLKAARTVRVTCANGTDLRLELAGRDSVDQTGLCHEPGTWGVLPDIETAVGPLEGSAEGTWVVDGAIVQIGMVEEPIQVSFSQGRVTSIEGGKDATILRTFLESYEDPMVYHVAELGIGLNPKAKMERSLLEREAEYGTMHVGLGHGASFGSSIRAPVHCDLVVCNPILELDGRVILKDRTLFID